MDEDKGAHVLTAQEVSVAQTQTEHDAHDMARLGKKQVFKRNFHDLSIIGLTVMMMGTWEAIASTITFSLTNGGLAGSVWIYIGSLLCTIVVVVTMAEMASMAPTTGGQYHWVSEFGPPQYQKFLSYMVGWFSALAWQAGVAVTAYSSSGILQSAIAINHPSYDAQPYHGTLMMIAVAAVAALVNVFGIEWLPRLEVAILALHVVGFVAFIATLWGTAGRGHASAKQVFTEFANFGGWETVGGAVIVGQITATGSLFGYDAAAHMSEEVRDASLTVPRAMLTTILVNGLLGLITIITLCFRITNLGALLAPAHPFPFIPLLLEATGSTAAATTLACTVAALTVGTCVSALAAGSRQLFAFARDDGLPAAWLWRKVVPLRRHGAPVPLPAVLASLAITVLLSLLPLFSAAALSSIFGLLSCAGGASYSAALACLLWRRLAVLRHQHRAGGNAGHGAHAADATAPLPPARFRLPPVLGAWCNAFALAYMAFATIVCFFPAQRGAGARGMNWSVVVFGGVVVGCVAAYWCGGRRAYRGPVVCVVRAGEGRDLRQ
ncbi:uncharacterized protein K452DRAFT_285965 [Aplosporella prunicola CBS 121167]|uniref:Amino acid permease/ SLC12A domain-containing protein n=1 Tax=Aplosporella prunicola CBS 121167 TaxID=1176127 RepID=A0A6A6BKT5_9PEZI|nr:uncharacterized protein K452DRAFT_285965 [Aplosporella prunicola CBS 121167]KAF2143925.1 hypothetical protein K452DRAFT_285965 [Aplosporella prunicola CBS 121167]